MLKQGKIYLERRYVVESFRFRKDARFHPTFVVLFLNEC